MWCTIHTAIFCYQRPSSVRQLGYETRESDGIRRTKIETQNASPCSTNEKINIVKPLDGDIRATSEQSELPTTPQSRKGRISYRSVAVIWLRTLGARRNVLCNDQAVFQRRVGKGCE